MTNIEIQILNPGVVAQSEKLMVCAARLTQKGHTIKTLDDFMALYEKGYKSETVTAMSELPHNTIRQFNMINVVIVGASRRFLAQITRRRVGVTFMSASLQYSDYSDAANFVVPYELIEKGKEATAVYLNACREAMEKYQNLVAEYGDHDAAAYAMPQGLANVLIISATPQAWVEMISQRVCRRNTKETQYVMLRIWEQLYRLNPIMFSLPIAGAPCISEKCPEGSMTCGRPISPELTDPTEILIDGFPLLVG